MLTGVHELETLLVSMSWRMLTVIAPSVGRGAFRITRRKNDNIIGVWEFVLDLSPVARERTARGALPPPCVRSEFVGFWKCFRFPDR